MITPTFVCVLPVVFWGSLGSVWRGHLTVQHVGRMVPTMRMRIIITVIMQWGKQAGIPSKEVLVP